MIKSAFAFSLAQEKTNKLDKKIKGVKIFFMAFENTILFFLILMVISTKYLTNMCQASEKNKTIATNWFNAFNQHQLNNLLSLYDEAAQHYSPKLKVRQPPTEGLIKGKEALRNWWQGAFDRHPSLRYEVTHLMADAGQVFMEYVRRVNGEEDLLVGEVLQIKNGLIVFSRVYHG